MVVPVDSNDNDADNLHIRLRNKFFENLEANGNHNDYEEVDLDRFRTDDNYCKRFILHKKGNFDAALEMADEALKWRKSFGVKDVNQASIPLEFFQAKAVFPYNQDKEGNPIIMILVRYHRKVPEFTNLLRKFVIYWVELMEEQTNGGQMTVIMSCAGAGLSNLDLDLIKFLITLFRSYYPHSLAHILIYEMPWILNPAWKIIKAWLPEDFVEKIKFVNKTSLQEYVSEDNLPLDMGGTNTTEYEPPTSLEDNANGNVSNDSDKKKIANGHIGSGRGGQVLVTDDYTIVGGMLKISPATELKFIASAEVAIKLTCVSDSPITYKVKTNNIDSYRVKPSIGIIEPDTTIDINVVLLSGFRPSTTDKFLIMAMEVSDPNLSTSSLNALWKSSPTSVVADHKLKCIGKTDKLAENEEVDVGQSLKDIKQLLGNLENKVDALQTSQESLKFQLRMSSCFIFLLLVLFLSNLFLSESFLLQSFVSKQF